MTPIKHAIELLLLKLLFVAFRLLPLDVASYIGGFMARAIGPFLSAHATAVKNLSAVFPEWPADKKRETLTGMWDNLGRVAAELAHLANDRLYERITLEGADHMPKPGKAVLFFSGHFGNWELLSMVAFRHGISITSVYRKANNPYVDDMITALRATQSVDMIPKGFKGAIKMVRAIKSGHSIAMLVDQKMNDGISVPFFGRDAMTAPAIAEFALRYDMPIIPARVSRTDGCRFTATVYPPLSYAKTGDEKQDTLAIMTAINRTLEKWIREHPSQWFWVHKRWPSA